MRLALVRLMGDSSVDGPAHAKARTDLPTGFDGLSRRRFEEKPFLAEGGAQVVEPGGSRVVPGEERPPHPMRVPCLQEVEHEAALAVDVRGPEDPHLAGQRRHRRPAHRAGQPRDPAVSVAVDVPGPRQGHLEVVAWSGVALDEHVVGDDALADAVQPQPRPGLRRVVDVAHQRSLHADLRPGGPHPLDRAPGDFRLHLHRMAVVGHQREMPARGADLFEEPQQVVGVVVGDESVRPVGQGLRSDSQVAQVRQVFRQQRLHVFAQHAGLHDQRVAAGDQHVGDLGMGLQVGDEGRGLARREAHVRQVDELGPAKTVGAIGVAGLALTGKEQHRLPVLVLQAGDGLAAERRHVVGLLTVRMGIETPADGLDPPANLLLGRLPAQQVAELAIALRLQHLTLDEGQLVHGIFGHAAPVDELAQHVLVGAERQHPRNHGDGFAKLVAKVAPEVALRQVA